MNLEIRKCKYCGEEKTVDNFRKCNGRFRGDCKKCEGIKHKEYCKTHKEIIKKISHNKYMRNKNKYHERNIENRDTIKEYNKKYYKKNIKYYKEYAKKYRDENKNKLNEYNKQYRKEHSQLYKKYYKLEYQRNINNPLRKLKLEIRNNIRQSFTRKNYVKNKHLQEICKCTIDELVEHLIKTYEDNYNEQWNWEYLGKVHIDHIIPLATAETQEDVEKLCHYTNLQLLKAEDNLKKWKN